MGSDRINLISVGQLTDAWMKITFDGGLYKITKDAMIMSHGKNKGTLHDIRL